MCQNIGLRRSAVFESIVPLKSQGWSGIVNVAWSKAREMPGRSRRLIFNDPDDHLIGGYIASNWISEVMGPFTLRGGCWGELLLETTLENTCKCEYYRIWKWRQRAHSCHVCRLRLTAFSVCFRPRLCEKSESHKRRFSLMLWEASWRLLCTSFY